MATKHLLVGNWKMNLGVRASKDFLLSIAPSLGSLKYSEVWLTPSSVALPAIGELATGLAVRVGAQNVHWKESGAFTGELSVAMLREVGCSFALTGHSERRHLFGESSALVAQRTLGALNQGFTAIHCIGETLTERTANETREVFKSQLSPLVDNLTAQNVSHLVLAYEPVWAIGTGKVASLNEIQEASNIIEELWRELFPISMPPLLYGGSVDPDNVGGILSSPGINGCLIGGASIHKEKFPAIIRCAEALRC